MECQFRSVAIVVLCQCVAAIALAQETARQQDEQAIRQTAAEYVAALARGDSKALLGFWTADGDIVDETGRSYPASEVIGRQEAVEAGAKKPEVKLTSSSLRFLTADVALENGTSEVVHPAESGLPAQAGRFSVIWVKKEGKWRLAQLREMRGDDTGSADPLAELDWMAGEWSGQSGETTIEVSARWNATRTFLLRDLQILHGGNVVFRGAQRIGWDPLTKRVKSWVFDTHGGFGEGTWNKSGASWVVQASGVLGDGQPTNATNVYTPEGKDAFQWKTIGSVVGGVPGPELDIKLERKRSEK
jgi:uncharacterized protein (TIGR02246 family)